MKKNWKCRLGFHKQQVTYTGRGHIAYDEWIPEEIVEPCERCGKDTP